VHEVLNRHPITVDRDKYLKRALAMQLLQLDQLEVAFRDKAFPLGIETLRPGCCS